ncbi:hypothetical protein C5167_043231 [Papaver somniferum]|uniref:Uncharacterized protein n=1 Tax=Papaver somniferum TaxID=3469 RepID=A0A4Y7L627_PAPSO|nr:hypothetical protein C5167_043231 [Papaver somniferum]
MSKNSSRSNISNETGKDCAAYFRIMQNGSRGCKGSRSYNIGLGFKTPREATEANNGNQNYYFNFESSRIRVGDAYDLKDQLDKQGKKRLVDYLENVKSCFSKSDGLIRVTDVMIDGKIDVAAGQVNVGKGCPFAVMFVSKLVPRS